MTAKEAKVTQRKTVSIDVRSDLWQKFRGHAIQHGVTAIEALEEAIEAWLEEHRAVA